jgi:hypothetical protein
MTRICENKKTLLKCKSCFYNKICSTYCGSRIKPNIFTVEALNQCKSYININHFYKKILKNTELEKYL